MMGETLGSWKDLGPSGRFDADSGLRAVGIDLTAFSTDRTARTQAQDFRLTRGIESVRGAMRRMTLTIMRRYPRREAARSEHSSRIKESLPGRHAARFPARYLADQTRRASRVVSLPARFLLER